MLFPPSLSNISFQTAPSFSSPPLALPGSLTAMRKKNRKLLNKFLTYGRPGLFLDIHPGPYIGEMRHIDFVFFKKYRGIDMRAGVLCLEKERIVNRFGIMIKVLSATPIQTPLALASLSPLQLVPIWLLIPYRRTPPSRTVNCF